jgi:hypothetical protein
MGGGADLEIALGVVKRSLNVDFFGSIGRVVMMAMAAMCLRRIRYTRLLFYLVGDDLPAGVEEWENLLVVVPMEWWISFSLHTCVTYLVSEDSDKFKSSMSMTAPLGRWFLGACAPTLPDYHQ